MTEDPTLKPMLPPISIAPPPRIDLSQINDEVNLPDAKTGQVRRNRGRPPGSRNKVREPEAGINPPSSIRIPQGRQNPSVVIEPPKKEDVSELKKAKAEQYAEYIVTELNDKLFMLIIGMTNGAITADALYKQGRVPPKAQGNPNFSDFGNAIAIPPDLADSWGKFLAELTYTDAGKSFTKATEGKTLGVVVAGVAALFSTYRYTQQLKPMIEMLRASQAAQQEQGESNEG